MNQIKTAILLTLVVWPFVGLTQDQRPNVLFVLVDDMGWSDLASYGHRIHETPHTDRLAREGMRFTEAYAPAPVCGPSRCAIMTGKFPSRTGFTDNYITLKGKKTKQFMPLEEFTLGEAFQAGGYQTGFAGKWHLDGRDPSRLPNTQGFDVALGSDRGPGRKFFTPYNMGDLTDGPEGEYLPDRLTSEAIRMMDDFSKKDQPWLMYLSFYIVHSPFIAKEEKIEKYTEKAQQANVKLNAEYAAMVESMDENVGRLLKWLDEKELRKDTIIVFTSDNGGFHQATQNRPLRSYKGHLYDGGIREPLIIDWPGVTKPGSVCGTPVHGVDFYPTLLEMAGLPIRPEQHIDGVSLVPLLKGDANFDRGPMIWHYHDQLPPNRPYSEPGSAIRIGDWKYLHFYEDGRQELYNLRDDIGESKNLVQSMPKKASELRKALDAALKEHGSLIPASGRKGLPKKMRAKRVSSATTAHPEGSVLIDFGNPVKPHTEKAGYNNIGAKDLLQSYDAEGMALTDVAGSPVGWTLTLAGKKRPAISDARVRLDLNPGMVEAVDNAPGDIADSYSINAWKDGIKIDGGDVILSFGNLDADKTYNLLFFGAHAKNSVKQSWVLSKGTGGNSSDKYTQSSTDTGVSVSWKKIKPVGGSIQVTISSSGVAALNFAMIEESGTQELVARSASHYATVTEAHVYTNEKGASMPYRLFVPKKRDPKKKYPLVFFLHGAGARGDDNVRHLLPWFAGWTDDAVQDERPCFVLMPQCPAKQQWVNTPWKNGSYSYRNVPISEPMALAKEIFDQVIEKNPIDESRIYVVGLSMGGYGAWNFIMRYPDLVAAAVACCGAGDPSMANRLRDLPIWAFHGDMDTIVPFEGSKDMVDAIKEEGGKRIKFTVYKDFGHQAHKRAWKSKELVEWLFKQKSE